MDRVDELRSMVSNIANEIGLDATDILHGEIDALGKRLESVRESISILADIADARDANENDCTKNIQDAKSNLNEMQKVRFHHQFCYNFITNKSIYSKFQAINEPTTSDPEQRLVALRTQLLSLGRSEGQLNELRKQVADSTSTTELSIIEVLELWQQIFRDTFQQYQRLSMRLAQSEDGASALKMWQDYLLHVQTFLSEALPEDYSKLNECRHLCEVHQNVLTSQKSILNLKTDKDASSMDQTLINKFNKLSELHNETLARIIDRHGEIESRIRIWNNYHNDQTRLLDWLKEKEHEKARLQLRYIHLQRIPLTLQSITNMLQQISQAESDCVDLRSQQTELMKFSHDNAVVTSMRMENAAISQRIQNLQASLETWRDFLQRITDKSDEYNKKVAEIKSQFENVQSYITDISNEMPHSVTQVDNTLTELRQQRNTLNRLTSDLEAMNVMQEELKECLCPSNMKTIRRTVYVLWQQHADLDEQLTYLINQIEERLTMSDLFYEKYERFMVWMDGIEERLNSETCGDIQNSEKHLRRLEKDLQSECALREREKEWLLTNGRELLTFYGTNAENDKQQRIEIKRKLDILVDRWERIKNLCKAKSNKIHDLKNTMNRLEERVAAIRSWLHKIEMELSKPLIFESSANSAFDKLIHDHDKLQRSIEKESGNVGEVLNLCEMLLSDMDRWKAHIDTNSLSVAAENLDRMWKNVCKSSAQHKQRIHTVWTLLLEVLTLTTEDTIWINRQESDMNELACDLDKLNKAQAEERISELEGKISEFEQRQSRFNQLSQSYSKLVKTNGLDPTNIQELTNPTKILLSRYNNLVPKALELIGKLNMDIKMHREFMNLHGKAIVNLAQIDTELENLQQLDKQDPEEKLKAIQVIEQKLRMCEPDLASADSLGLEIMKRSDGDDVVSIQSLIDEYQTSWGEITKIIQTIKYELTMTFRRAKEPATVEERSEADSAVQVNTLPSLNRTTSITPKDAYVHELQAALKECQENLDQLEKEVNNSNRRPGSQVIQKLSSNCQSSVELLNHLSNILVTECYCNDDEACVAEVTEITKRYEALIALWKARERQVENRYFMIPLKIFDFLFFCFVWMILVLFAIFNRKMSNITK